MHIRSLAGKNICILGFGKEGQAMVAALEKYAPGCEITVADKNDKIEVPENYWKQVGTGWLENLHKFDVLIKSPGIPPSDKLEAISDKLTSPTQIFFDSIKDSGAIIIGVTGSKGKSTTSTLIHSILQVNCQKLKVNCYLIGNIGEPAINHIENARSNTTCGERSRTIFVQEMSSYQLMDLTSSPHIAVVTSFFPEHLDYHGSLEAYLEAKKHIARFQSKTDIIFFNAKSPECKEIAKESKGKRIPFSADDSPVTLDQILLKGTHNLSNIAAAYQVALHLRADPKKAIDVIRNFHGLPHRLQSLGIHHGFEWIDDSISTTPQSAIAALDALGDSVTMIILGGQDRGYDFSPLADRLKKSNVKMAILLPDSGPTIGKAIRKATSEIECVEVETVEEAVEKAISLPSSPNPFPRGGKGNEMEQEMIAKKPMDATILHFARTMRREPTKAEKFLWQLLRGGKIGKKFRRQHPFGSKILDFYCDECRLAIEVDGSIHDTNEHQQNDREREAALGEYEIRTLRFTNDEVLNDTNNVIRKIQEQCDSPLPSGKGLGVREAGRIILLSPSAPSYGHFKNFEERGDRFKTAIEKL